MPATSLQFGFIHYSWKHPWIILGPLELLWEANSKRSMSTALANMAGFFCSDRCNGQLDAESVLKYLLSFLATAPFSQPIRSHTSCFHTGSGAPQQYRDLFHARFQLHSVAEEGSGEVTYFRGAKCGTTLSRVSSCEVVHRDGPSSIAARTGCRKAGEREEGAPLNSESIRTST